MERDGMVLQMQGDCERVVRVGCEDPQDARFESFNTFILVTISHNINRPRSHQKRLKEKGYRSLSIVLVHSYTYPERECAIGNIAHTPRVTYVSESEHLPIMIKMVSHGVSSTANVYLT